MKRLLSLGMVLLLSASVVAGCTSKPVATAQTQAPATSGEANSGATSEKPAESAAPAAEASVYPFKEKVKIKVAEASRPAYADDNLVEKKINEMLNVEVEYLKIPEVSYKEQLGIMLASKQLPDIVFFPSINDSAEWATKGAIMPLDDLLKSDGQDITNNWIEDDWSRVKSPTDEKVYCIPAIMDLKEAFSISYRKDWLDKLGLQAPTTLEEWKNVLIAVRDKDPNGNGQKDEIPYVGLLRGFENAFGIQSTEWQIKDGKYISKFEHPNYIEYINYMRDMYKEGLIDKEFYSRNKTPAQIEETFFADKAFSNENWAAIIRTATDTLREVNPDALLVASDPIKGPHGDQQIMGRSRWMSASGITVSAKDPKVAMQFLNWFFTEDGINLTNYGVEGETYDLVDGKPKLKPEYSTFEKSRIVGINKTTESVLMTVDYYNQCLLEGKSLEEATVSFQNFFDGLFRNTPFIYIPAQQYATPTLTEKWGPIKQALIDAEVQTIIGNKSVEDFEKLIQEQKAAGLDKIAAEMNEIYAKVK